MDDPTPAASAKCDPTRVPASLQAEPCWVCWKYVPKDGNWTKCPFNARTGAAASSTDRATWSTFSEAVGAWRAGGYAGIGFVFSAEGLFAGIDLDECIDESGAVVATAQEIIDQFASYAEVSPSGRGVKIFIRGKKPPNAGCKSKIIPGYKETEVYDRDRFFTVTGQAIEGTPGEVLEGQVALDALCARLWPRPPSSGDLLPAQASAPVEDDQVVLTRAAKARNGEKFRRLFEGDTSQHRGDESAADLALCNILAHWTRGNAEQIDRLFRRSGLYRAKWDEPRGDRTYGRMTIERALASARGSHVFSSPPQVSEADDSSDPLVPLGERDPATGKLVLSPRSTLPTAEAYTRAFHHHVDGCTVKGYGGLLMEWRGNCYREVEEGEIKHKLQPWLHDALRYVVNRRTGDFELAPFESNPTTVNQAFEAIRMHVHLPSSTPSPSWLGDAGNDRPPALELLSCKSSNLHLPTGRVLPPTPALFTTSALDFDYDPAAEPPIQWIKFLEQLFGDDLQSVELLQEWMGYCLIPDTSQQKMLLLVGPRRSGKGTIGRVLKQLVGAANVTGPTTSALAGPFGLQPLLGKSLAIVSDARFGGENVGTVIERLLCISGEDTLTVDRKFLGSVSVKLSTRFVFFSNELPRLNDASTALAGRFLILRLTTSFYGKEDPMLTERLLTELPGILLWAIAGWRRLRERGYFIQPESGNESVRDMEDLASPVGAFVRDHCIVGSGQRVYVNPLYQAWRSWCEREGRTAVGTKQSFAKDLLAAVPGLRSRRDSAQTRFYEGIGLAEEAA